jgi:molybdopterin-guanine dinucleotide biosynthesis protein
MEDWHIEIDGKKVIVTHKDGSGVVVEDTDESSIAACILARFAADFKQSLKVDFLDCIVSGYSDEEIEKVIASIESNGDGDSVNYQNNIALIAEYRADKLVEDQINKFEDQLIDSNHPLFHNRYSVHRHDDGGMVAHGRRDLLEQKCILRSYGNDHWIKDNINTRISYILIDGNIKKMTDE